MDKNLRVRLVRWIGIGIASIIIIIAIVLNATRLLVVVAAHHSDYIEKWVSKAIHRPVHIGGVHADWQGFEPEITFQNVSIRKVNPAHMQGEPDAKKKSFIRIKQLSIGIDIFHSLLQWKLLPGRLTIKGTHLNIYQAANNTLRFSGILTEKEQSQLSDHSAAFKNLLGWFLTEADVVIDDVSIDWHASNGMTYPIRHLRLLVRNDLSGHPMLGGAFELNQSVPTQIQFGARLYNINLSKSWFDADMYFQVKHINLKRCAGLPWIQTYLKNIQVKKGIVNLKIWMTWKRSHLQFIQSALNAKHVEIHLPTTKKPLTVNHLSANLAWHQYLDGWGIQADKIRLKMNNHKWPEDHFGYRVVYTKDNQLVKQMFHLDYLQLQELRSLAIDVGYWPMLLRRFFIHHQPKGVLKKIHFVRMPSKKTAYQLSLQFDHIGLRSYRRFPGMQNISGSLILTSLGGQISFGTKKAKMFFPMFYSHPIPLDQFQMLADWKQDPSGLDVRVSHYFIKTGILSSRGKLHLTVPKSGHPIIDLLAKYRIQDVAQLPYYLPDRYLSKKTYSRLANTFKKRNLGDLSPSQRRWGSRRGEHHLPLGRRPRGFPVQAKSYQVKTRSLAAEFFKNAQLTNGTVFLQGAIQDFPFDKHQGHFEVSANFKGISLNYYPGWPVVKNLDGNLQVKDRSMQANIQYAEIGGNSIRQVQATIADIKHPVLKIFGQIDSTFSQALQSFRHSPLHIGKWLNAFSLMGPLKLDLKLTIPFQGRHTSVSSQGTLYLQNATLSLPKFKLSLNDINGQIIFHNTAFRSKALSVNLFGSPLHIQLSTLKNKKNTADTQIILGGHLDVEKLRHNFALPKLKYVAGNTDFRALIKFHPPSKDSHFPTKQNILDAVLITDLQGIQLQHLPAFFNKAANDRRSLRIQLTYRKRTPIQAEVDYNHQVSMAVSLNHHLKVLSGALHFGKGHAMFQDLPGFVIAGRLQSLKWSQWEPYILPFIEEEDGAIKIPKILGLPLRYVEFHFGKVSAFHQTLKNLYFKLIPREHDWFLNIQNEKIAGILFFPSYPGGTWTGRFEHLYLPKQKSTSKKSKSKKPQSIDPRKIPPINFVVKHFEYGKTHYGEVKLVARPTKSGLSIKQFSIKSPLFHLSIKGLWQQINKQQKTSIKGYFQSQDLGNVLSNWGIDHVLSKGEGKTTFSLLWGGAPNQFAMKRLTGKIHFDFRHGRLLKTGKKTNMAELSLGRLLNVFSIQSLFRHLTLNFSDITAKGLEFNKFKGDLIVSKGISETKDTYLDGPVVKIKVRGKINFLTESYNLHLSVLPYVTSSLPLIVGIIGGPIAGAVTWVVNKLVISEIGKVVGFTYNVKGSWDKSRKVKLPVPAVTSIQETRVKL